ncbi:hypothetical protein CEXT_286131 [Caerostris extrusa]|uniref:Uncharacterized protein n=1 Tax=Caerostris extrusa TaxID=172846 RepID=A0AAV4SJP1_CAEEX|nr:hypothetical protein CEXT_286131 [Caerostris extrusa]
MFKWGCSKKPLGNECPHYHFHQHVSVTSFTRRTSEWRGGGGRSHPFIPLWAGARASGRESESGRAASDLDQDGPAQPLLLLEVREKGELRQWILHPGTTDFFFFFTFKVVTVLVARSFLKVARVSIQSVIFFLTRLQ